MPPAYRPTTNSLPLGRNISTTRLCTTEQATGSEDTWAGLCDASAHLVTTVARDYFYYYEGSAGKGYMQ